MFSIRQFAADQIQTYSGQPYTLYQISRLNGVVDTTIVNFFNMDWASILHAFAKTDISDPKFLGQYSFNGFDDAITGNRDFVYTAKEPDLFTRMLQINTDPSNNRISSIYIETRKGDLFGSSTQKLLYIPLHVIQIQETAHSLIGPARNLRVDYRFMGDEEEDATL